MPTFKELLKMNSKNEPDSILIADDNPNNLRVLESMLTSFGFNVRIATNGLEAVESATLEPPDIIILDIHMPVMDGYEACIQIKNHDITCDIPIIFASAINEEFNKVKAFEIGGYDYITKPIAMEELRARVSLQLKLSRQYQVLEKQAEELKKFNETMIEREMRVIELKKEVNDYAVQLGIDTPYKILTK
jgi:PleD family two-component response regulator